MFNTLILSTAMIGGSGPQLVEVQPGDDLQAAIDLVAPGGLVLLHEGTHQISSTLTIVDKSITIAGSSGPTRGDWPVRIAPASQFRLMEIHADGPPSVVQIENMSLSGGKSLSGGALQVSRCHVSITNCEFAHNVALGWNGGAIEIDSGLLDAVNCDFRDNDARVWPPNDGYAPSGGALFASSSDVQIIGCTFDGNSAEQRGGAMAFQECQWQVLNSRLHSNSSFFTFDTPHLSDGGGISSRGGTGGCVDSVFEANAGRGGGLHCRDGVLAVSHCRFIANYGQEEGLCSLCWGGSGGGLRAESMSHVDISHCDFTLNIAGSGGGIFLQDSSTIVQACTFVENTGPGCNYSGTHGRGLAAESGSTQVIECRFAGHRANHGASLSCKGGTILLQDCNFSDSRAWNCEKAAISGLGGAVYLDANATVSRCTFHGTCADLGGDAIWGSADTTTSECVGCTTCSNAFDGDLVDDGSSSFDPDCPVPCTGDLSMDGVVDGLDLGLFLANVGIIDCSSWDACQADLDGDGEISGSDLGILLVHWGDCP